MADPRRLLDAPAGLSELERRVLTAGGAAAPGQRVTREIWTALSARLPPPGGGPTGGEGPAGVGGATAGAAGAGAAGAAGAKGVALLSIAKAASIGLSLGVVAMAGVGVLTPRDVPTEAPLPAAAAFSVVPAAPAGPKAGSAFERAPTEPGIEPAPRSSAPVIERAPAAPAEQAISVRPAPTSTGLAAFPLAAPKSWPAPMPPATAPVAAPPNPTPAPVASVTTAHEESRLVAAARDALRGGSPARALALLDQAQRKFPGGTLAQEREALSIEALAASGQRGRARELARRFLSAHPSSFHAARVRAFAE